ncbi:MAG: hypothetical protein CR975_04015 [Gammaproteobacteria bacterium]|nr:MAG: hypothetical protein CR975_04015 [Gammaproteobacteria bacterium]
MTFVNERISDEDRKKYDPEGKYLHTSGWTIDRENEIFIVTIRSGGKEYNEEYVFECDVLYWKGYFIKYTKKNIERGSLALESLI